MDTSTGGVSHARTGDHHSLDQELRERYGGKRRVRTTVGACQVGRATKVRCCSPCRMGEWDGDTKYSFSNAEKRCYCRYRFDDCRTYKYCDERQRRHTDMDYCSFAYHNFGHGATYLSSEANSCSFAKHEEVYCHSQLPCSH